jgi:hypothetical protein
MTFYRMSGYEPGTYLEIYLPKKTLYQTFLFDVLTSGFDLETVRRHFLSADKRPGILELLGPNPAWMAYDAEYIAKLRPFLHGYSMYEVDGVFKGGESSQDSVVEERTQVLRLLFRLDLDEVAIEAKAEDLDRKVLRATVCDYLRAHDRQAAFQKSRGKVRRIFSATQAWRDQLGFFVFGYIVYELGRNIEALRTAGSIGKTEDEIWVANFANMELDRVLWRPTTTTP